jgi:rRNA processing protein Krr1/Pno1
MSMTKNISLLKKRWKKLKGKSNRIYTYKSEHNHACMYDMQRECMELAKAALMHALRVMLNFSFHHITAGVQIFHCIVGFDV